MRASSRARASTSSPSSSHSLTTSRRAWRTNATTRRRTRARRSSNARDASSVVDEIKDDGDTEDEEEEEEEEEDARASTLAAILNAYDRSALAAGATRTSEYVRERVRELTPKGKMKLLTYVSSKGIENAWTIAGLGYALTREERARAGADGGEEDFHVVNEILGDDDEAGDGDVRVFEGKVSKLPGSFLNRFAKAFYVETDDDPMRSAASRRFLGRAPIRKGPLDALLPLYFASNDFSDDSVFVPGTRERADVELDYRNVPVAPKSRPRDAGAGGVSWPQPRLPLYPFDTLVDYLRPLGPGVIAGRGYRLIDGVPKTFLSFILVRRP